MDIYLINLDQRPNRLAKMAAQLDKLGLPFTRVAAVNGLGDDDIGYPSDHPNLSKPEFACYLSHLSAYRAFLASDAPYALILEDDMIVSNALPLVLAQNQFFENPNAIVRIEGPANDHRNKPCRVDPVSIASTDTHSIFRLKTKSFATGAYVIPRALAQQMVDTQANPRNQIDVVLFCKYRHKCLGSLIFQLSPALAIQQRFLLSGPKYQDEQSDIMDSRIKRGTNKNWLSRHISWRKNNFQKNIERLIFIVSGYKPTYKYFTFEK